MADLERELNRARNDPGRARKRKIKRESTVTPGGQAGSNANMRSSARSRAVRRSEPSERENLVADEIRNRSDVLTSTQGKLSSRLGMGKQVKTEAGSRSRTRREKLEGLSSEPLFTATPRAETQRISDQDNEPRPTKSRRVYDTRIDGAPPVMVRGGMGGMAFGRVANSRLKKSGTPKRRIDVPLRVTGAELRLPAIPLMHLGWRAVSLIMVLMMSASLVLMWKAPIFQVSSVEAEGLKRLTVADLSAVMGTFGKSIFTLNPTILREALKQAFPEFSKISVRVNLPASVKVVVTERQPVISWTQEGVETWVDADGISFPPRGVPESPMVQVEGYGTPPSDTTTLSGNDAQNLKGVLPIPNALSQSRLKLSPELVDAIMALGAKMPEGTVLVYDSEHGLGWNDPNGWDVFFGNEDQDMEMKLAVYQALVEKLKAEGIQPALISVEYLHAPYYRMER